MKRHLTSLVLFSSIALTATGGEGDPPAIYPGGPGGEKTMAPAPTTRLPQPGEGDQLVPIDPSGNSKQPATSPKTTSPCLGSFNSISATYSPIQPVQELVGPEAERLVSKLITTFASDTGLKVEEESELSFEFRFVPADQRHISQNRKSSPNALIIIARDSGGYEATSKPIFHRPTPSPSQSQRFFSSIQAWGDAEKTSIFQTMETLAEDICEQREIAQRRYSVTIEIENAPAEAVEELSQILKAYLPEAAVNRTKNNIRVSELKDPEVIQKLIEEEWLAITPPPNGLPSISATEGSIKVIWP